MGDSTADPGYCEVVLGVVMWYTITTGWLRDAVGVYISVQTVGNSLLSLTVRESISPCLSSSSELFIVPYSG